MSIFLPKGLGAVADIFGGVGTPDPSKAGGLGSILGSGLSDYFPPPPPPYPHSSLANALLQATTKRKVYFAFDFDDLMRVNIVRNAWRIKHPDSAANRSFYDRSIWESSNIRGDEGLKELMRDAVQHSSAICVLVGTNTWKSRWVKYEIARAVVDDRGLLGVQINGLRHHQRQASDPHGHSPLDYMGIYHSPNGRYYLYERRDEFDPRTGRFNWPWRQYEDFKDAVSLPRYIPSITQGYVMPLAVYTLTYDYVGESGHTNIGAWIDRAAAAVGR